jgi:hypothetical protein
MAEAETALPFLSIFLSAISNLQDYFKGEIGNGFKRVAGW